MRNNDPLAANEICIAERHGVFSKCIPLYYCASDDCDGESWRPSRETPHDHCSCQAPLGPAPEPDPPPPPSRRANDQNQARTPGGSGGLAPRERIMLDICDELIRQREKFGVQRHPPIFWLPILMEEVGEVAREMCEHGFYKVDGKDGPETQHKQPWAICSRNYRKELVQVAAVAVAALESLAYHAPKIFWNES